jgi:hypothetical protein
VDAAWLGALASLISALIVCATAVAAFAQLRHYRNANDIVVYLRIVDKLDSEEMQEAVRSLPKIPELLRDPGYRERLRTTTEVIPEFLGVFRLMQFLEHFAVLVNKGGVAESLVLSEYADNFEYYWEILREAVYLRREALGPHISAAFEHLAMRATAYRASGRMDREYSVLLRDPRGGAAP